MVELTIETPCVLCGEPTKNAAGITDSNGPHFVPLCKPCAAKRFTGLSEWEQITSMEELIEQHKDKEIKR